MLGLKFHRKSVIIVIIIINFSNKIRGMKRERVTVHVRHYVIYDRDQRLPGR